MSFVVISSCFGHVSMGEHVLSLWSSSEMPLFIWKTKKKSSNCNTNTDCKFLFVIIVSLFVFFINNRMRETRCLKKRWDRLCLSLPLFVSLCLSLSLSLSLSVSVSLFHPATTRPQQKPMKKKREFYSNKNWFCFRKFFVFPRIYTCTVGT